ncbi:MAG: Asp-tRNA(Asn)/Glu-tRNA(Gln) amidotransferase subunit GatC [Candidatus Adlerbacteria bacterium]|nr:Asp-tRNA(Asn)/Glu-tRNA(Gln) amidotransferase subunit GatC [Candidatus Adlerbacteria bacterium]
MISKEEIEKLAELSRLKLGEEEIAALQKDISSILDYVGQISALEGGEIKKEVGLNHNVMREDIPYVKENPLLESRDAVLEALPKREGDYAVVRKILHKND